jgi:hypothetical protein
MVHEIWIQDLSKMPRRIVDAFREPPTDDRNLICPATEMNIPGRSRLCSGLHVHFRFRANQCLRKESKTILSTKSADCSRREKILRKSCPFRRWALDRAGGCSKESTEPKTWPSFDSARQHTEISICSLHDCSAQGGGEDSSMNARFAGFSSFWNAASLTQSVR